MSRGMVVAGVAGLIWLAGCGRSELTGAAPGAKKGIEIAVVNGQSITLEELQREMGGMPPQLRALMQTREGQQNLLDNLIVRELVYQRGKADGVDQSPEVRERLEAIRRNLTIEATVRKVTENETKVSGEEIDKYYAEHRDEFKGGDQIRASHILVGTEAEAMRLHAQLRQGGNFEQLARAHSIDGSASRGGDLGYFERGRMVPEFERAAFSLKAKGDLSPVVRSQFGFHIIKLTDRRAGPAKNLEQAREEIRGRLQEDRRRASVEQYVKDLKAKAKITIHEDRLAGPAAPAPPMPGPTPGAPALKAPAEKGGPAGVPPAKKP